MDRYLLLVWLLRAVLTKEIQPSFAGCKLQPQCQDSLKIAVADFSQSLYADIAARTSQDNFVFSPLSIHSALALLYAGSTTNSKTQNELADALGVLKSQFFLQNSYKELTESYRNRTQESFLYGNSIWAKNGFNIAKNFTTQVKDSFGAEIQNIDFTKNTSVAVVNDWISKKTKDLIPKLVQEFSSSTSMFLANALYFKDKWLAPFQEKNETEHPLDKELFYGDSTLRVPMMMTRNVVTGYGSLNLGSHNATFVTIPYINDQFEMQIILPSDKPKGKGLAIMENLIIQNIKRDKHSDQSHNIFLSPKKLLDNVEDVRLVMPKFSVSTKFDASSSLKSLGVTQIFKEAELGNFGEGDPLAVSSILHKAVVKVDKEGTEGAAATGVELVLLSGSFGQNIDVNVDRPFIFIVQDKINNIPILVGRIKNPLK
eukprot:GFUD01013611.1.p1 GENE.GFUD01013611.1~~GFUD01013611.1.p1  ORF type:complete len:450 (-),score=105.85 GFUD01013611.1:173-1456(-)